MPFVHSLVKTQRDGTTGWCAPVELGETAPHYVSFVIPVDDGRRFFPKYRCETLKSGDGEKRRESHDLVLQGEDSFVLRLGKRDVWFTVRPGPNDERYLPYVGALQHEDFGRSYAEIEPNDPETLDKLFDDENTFIIGCEPFTHYAGLKKLTFEE